MSGSSRRVLVDPTGKVRPLDPVAIRELRQRAGEYEIVPAPSGLMLLRHKSNDQLRPLRLAGEISTPGALIDVVAMIGHAGWRGELVVFEGSSERAIFFDHGSVMSASSNVDNERLGRVLFRQGVLTEAQVMDATLEAKQQKKRFGEALIALGYLSSDELYRHAADQTDAILNAAIVIERGMFYFFDGYDETKLSFTHRRSVTAALTDAVRRMDELKYFRERIPDVQHVPERLPGRTPPEGALAEVYAAVDGISSVEVLRRDLRQSEFELTRALFELCQGGYIAVRPPRPVTTGEIVDVFNTAIRLVLNELDSLGQGDAVREELMTYAAWNGVYEALFEGAGPFDDGTLDAQRIEQNVAHMSEPNNAARQLAEWLHEYASFAMFLARPHLSRAEEEGRAPSGKPKRRVSQKIRAVLSSIAPDAPDAPPSSRHLRG